MKKCVMQYFGMDLTLQGYDAAQMELNCKGSKWTVEDVKNAVQFRRRHLTSSSLSLRWNYQSLAFHLELSLSG